MQIILIFSMCISITLFALDPYTMSLEEARVYIKTHNLGWKAGITPNTYLPKEVLKSKLMGVFFPIRNCALKTPTKHLMPPNIGKPDALDWTNNNGNWMTPVKNQGGTGACAAFAVLGHFEAMINIASNNPDLDLDLSEQYLIACCPLVDCGGGAAGSGIAHWIRENGVPDEDCYPWRGRNSNCDERCSDWESRVKYYKTVRDVCRNPDTDAIKAALVDGPVATAMQITAMQARFYVGGTMGDFPSTNDLSRPLNHAVVIVGFDDARNGGSWKWKNSWGTSYGEAGYGWTRYGTQEMGSYSYTGTAYPEGGDQITVIVPNGGETYRSGEQLGVHWTTSSTGKSNGLTNLIPHLKDGMDTIEHINIYLSTDGKSSWITLATRTENDGAETFNIDDISEIANTYSTDCYVRVEDDDDTYGTGYDDSDAAFTIDTRTGFNTAKNAKRIPLSFAFSIGPNPIRSNASIKLTLPKACHVKIQVYDVTGRRVAIAKNERMKAGRYVIPWKPNHLNSGTYFCTIIAGENKEKKKLVIIK